MSTAFLQYLLEASVALALVYGLYRLLLHHDVFFGFNRVFVLVALVLSAIAPLVQLPVEQEIRSAIPMFQLPVTTVSATKPENVSWLATLDVYTVLLFVYGMGSLVAAELLLMQLWQLRRWRRVLPGESQLTYRLIRTGGKLPTFSFFRWLFWDDSQPLSETETRLVLAHEQTHIRQWHSADVMVLAFFKILFWFHPAVYGFQHALRTVHEYLADASAAQVGSAEAYNRLLSRQILHRLQLSFAQPFNQSQLTQRISMLKRMQTAKPAVWKMAVSLAVLFLVVIGFACTDRIAPISHETIAVVGIVTDVQGNPLPGANVVVKGKTVGTTTDAKGEYRLTGISPNDRLVISFAGFPTREIQPVENSKSQVALQVGPPPPPPAPPAEDEPFVVVEHQPEFPDGMPGLIKYLSENIKYPQKAREAGVYGTVFIAMIIKEDGSVSDVTVMKGITEELNAEALRVVKNMPKWKPGMQSGKNVPVRFSVPIKFAL